MNLRKETIRYLDQAFDNVLHYSGENKEENLHTWKEITADRFIGLVMQSLPEPVDTKAKYETDEGGGVFIDIKGKHNKHHVNYLAQFAEDQGWNHYYVEYADYLRGLYTLPNSMVESDHERRIYGTGKGPSTPDQESSQVR